MSGFCPHEWHGTTETDLQQMALGSGDYEYAVWSDPLYNSNHSHRLTAMQREQKIITDLAHALAVERRIIPYTEATFLALMDEVEASMKEARAALARATLKENPDAQG